MLQNTHERFTFSNGEKKCALSAFGDIRANFHHALVFSFTKKREKFC